MIEELKIGVFVCECGDEISGSIDVAKVVGEVSKNPTVAIARRLRYGCSKDGLEEIRNTIRKQNLNRMVVAGCSPRTHEPIFRRVCEEAGLNRFLFEMVNIRDHCSWVHPVRCILSNGVHSQSKKKATEKAIALTRMGVARVALLEPREPTNIEITPIALVIGGGIAGMTSALSLAKQGVLVKLIEKESELGGMLRDHGKIYPSMTNAAELIRAKTKSIKENRNIQLFTKAKVSTISGHMGDYHVTVNVGAGLGPAQKAHSFRVGAIIIATGANILKPKGIFGYGKGKNVITQFQLEHRLYHASQFENIKSVVMIQCVGARNEERPYCSRICCMTALKNAVLLRESYPKIEVSILFRDLQTAHILSQEDINRARGLDVKFYKARSPKIGNGRASFYDELSDKDKEIPHDLLVLSTPLIAQPNAQMLSGLLKIPIDEFGFLPDPQVKLKPLQFIDNGIYVCGTAHWPATVAESIYQASGVAARVSSLLSKSRIECDTLIAEVNEKLCRGCESCLDVCSFGAIAMETDKGKFNLSRVNPFLCKGCGACAVACPTGAMSMHHYTNRQFFAQIDAAMVPVEAQGELPLQGPRILGFCCLWGGYASADLAGASRLQYPSNLKIIRVDCSARVDPAFILRAFEVGADGVLIASCPIGECHYQDGNERCQKLSEKMKPLLSLLGIEPERLRMEWIGADEGERFAQLIKEFSAKLEKLGPSPLRGISPYAPTNVFKE